MTILTKETERGTTIVIQGSATLIQAREAREAFLNVSVPEAATLWIDLSGITEADFTFLQLLASFTKSLQFRGINLQWEKLPEAHFLKDLFALTGLEPGRDLRQEEPVR